MAWPAVRGCSSAVVIAALMVSFNLGVSAVAQAAPPNDDVENAQPLNQPGSQLPTAVGPVSGTTVGATWNSDEYNVCNAANNVQYANTLWYAVYPHVPGRLTVSARADDFLAVLSLFQRSATGQAEVIPNNTRAPCGLANSLDQRVTLDLDVVGGRTYFVQVGNPCQDQPACTTLVGLNGPFSLQLAFDPDSDGDGVLDSADGCPSAAGPIGGCPDLDLDDDGARNTADCAPLDPARSPIKMEIVGNTVDENCDNLLAFDRDGDHFLEFRALDGVTIVRRPNDDCNDGDGHVNPKGTPHPGNGKDDNCDGKREPYRVFPTAARESHFGQGSGVRFSDLHLAYVVGGSRVELTCTHRGCRRSLQRRVRRGGTLRFRQFNNRFLRNGTRVVIRITKREYQGRYFDLRVRRGKLLGGEPRQRCMNPGQSRPRRTCTTSAY